MCVRAARYEIAMYTVNHKKGGSTSSLWKIWIDYNFCTVVKRAKFLSMYEKMTTSPKYRTYAT